MEHERRFLAQCRAGDRPLFVGHVVAEHRPAQLLGHRRAQCGRVVVRAERFQAVQLSGRHAGWGAQRADVHPGDEALRGVEHQAGQGEPAHRVPDGDEPLEPGGVGVLQHGLHAAGERDRLVVGGSRAPAGQVDGDRRSVEQGGEQLPARRVVMTTVDENDAVELHAPTLRPPLCRPANFGGSRLLRRQQPPKFAGGQRRGRVVRRVVAWVVGVPSRGVRTREGLTGAS